MVIKEFLSRFNLLRKESPVILGEEPSPPSVKGIQLSYPTEQDGRNFVISPHTSRTKFFIYGDELWPPRNSRETSENRSTGIKLVGRQADSEGQRCLFEIATASGPIRVFSRRSDVASWNIFKLLSSNSAVCYFKINPGPTDFSFIEMVPAPYPW